VDLNRNFPDLDRIMFSNEEAHINHNNHLLEQVDRLKEPASAHSTLNDVNKQKTIQPLLLQYKSANCKICRCILPISQLPKVSMGIP
jgi:hypothetical protein